jgi:hypothetical protein
VNDHTESVFTRSDGDVEVRNPTSAALVTDLRPPGLRVGRPTGLSVLTPPPWVGDSGNQELVVGKLDGTTDQVLQDVSGTGLVPVAFGPGGATTGTADQVYAWFPGYTAGRLQVADNSAVPVTIAMYSAEDSGKGCWANTSVTGGSPAFPTAPSPLAAGQDSPFYFAGALTAAPASDQPPAPAQCMPPTPAGSVGEHAAYLVITPAGDPADEHIVKLTADTSWQTPLSIDSQVGGYLTAALQPVPFTTGMPETAWGSWQLTVSGGSTPAPSAAPAVAGFRLTAAPVGGYTPPSSPAYDDPCRPVYRFDVTGATWTSVDVPGQVTAQLPAMTVQASSDDGTTWQDLGLLMPSAAPSATAPTAAAAGTVTLGPASFYFQNPAGTRVVQGVAPDGVCTAGSTPPVTELRVLTTGRVLAASAPVLLKDLPAPPTDGTNPVSGVAVTMGAAPRANGVDRAGLTVQLQSSGGDLPPNDPRYGLVYYRDFGSDALVTGLYQPGSYADYTAAGPSYAADGSQDLIDNSLVTTDPDPQTLYPDMNDTGTDNGNTGQSSNSFSVNATSKALQFNTGATGGFGVYGTDCGGFCTLAVPTPIAPALYQAGDVAGDAGPVTGLLLQAATIPVNGQQIPDQAITSAQSLPLAFSQGNTLARPGDPSQFWAADLVDTALVAAGQLVTGSGPSGGTGCATSPAGQPGVGRAGR